MMLRSSVRGGRAVASGACVKATEVMGSSLVSARTLATAAAPAAAATAPSTQPRSSALFDYRRLKNRKGWKKVVPDEDLDFVVFPRERLGKTYELNWTICKYAVIPNKDGEAFHNLHSRGLQMLSNAAADKNKALHVTVPEEEYAFSHYFVLPSPPPAPAEGQTAPVDLMFVPENASVVNDGVAKNVSKEVRRFLSEGRYLFVHDGAVGSHSAAEEKVRFIVSSATTALLLKHLIPKQPTVNIQDFEESITVFVAPELKATAEALGVSSDRFTLVNFKTNQVFVAGTNAPEAVQQAVSSLATYLLGKKGALPLQCDSALTKDGKSVLFFGPGLLQQKPRNDLFGAHGHFWTNEGVSRMYDGASVANPDASLALNRGDLVFHATKGGKTTKTSLSVPLSLQGHQAPHPSAIVFVSPNSAAGLTKISAEEAAKHYLASFQYPVAVKPELLKQRFAYLLSNKNVTAYQVGAKSGKVNVDEINAQLHTALKQ